MVGLIISYTPPIMSGRVTYTKGRVVPSPTVANFTYNARWRVYDWRADRLTKLEIRDKSQRVAPPPPMTQGLLEQRSSNFNRRKEGIGGVDAFIRVAILLSVVECQCTKPCHFRRLVPKFGYHRNGLERSRKEGQIDHAHSHVYLSRKFGEDRSSTLWDNWSPRGQLTSAQVIAIRHRSKPSG